MPLSLQNKKIILAGGSGFLGVSLAHRLSERGAEVVCLTRSHGKGVSPARQVAWDARTLGEWQQELAGAAGLVNLAGRNVNCRKTPEHQDEILRSRVEATRVLGQAVRAVENPPPVWVQMSTAHIYGDPPAAVCDEDSPTGYGLAPTVGRAWEEAYAAAKLPNQRGVVLRTGFVLGRDQGAGRGALGTLVPLARWGLGGTIGKGRQGMSWIHEEDLNRLIERALVEVPADGPIMQGFYIASGPRPISQREFMRTLRRAVRMPLGLPATESMVRFGARWLLNTDPELALYGRYVVSRRLKEEGFAFRYAVVGEALGDLLGRK